MRAFRRAAVLALLPALAACTGAHVADSKHSWMPLSRAVLDNVNGAEISNDFASMAVGAVLIVAPLAIDAVSLPFHGLGHLMASKAPSPAPGE